MTRAVLIGLVLSLPRLAFAGMVITEWMYSGADGEFVEFTNIATDSVDMAGWSYDDDSRTPGSVDLSAFGVVASGESVLLTEPTAADFLAAWGLNDVKIVGENRVNLGREDEINLYDATGNLVDRLTYGDQTYAGTVRTQNASCNIPLADDEAAEVQTGWTLAAVNDSFGSWTSAQGDVGSPGTAPVPERAADETSLGIGQVCGAGIAEASLAIALGLMLVRFTSRCRRGMAG